MTWFDTGGERGAHEPRYRPTQLDVDAQAARMFGAAWKQPFEHAKAMADAEVAWRLDAARLAVEAAHNA